jgi:hypothetical protein
MFFFLMRSRTVTQPPPPRLSRPSNARASRDCACFRPEHQTAFSLPAPTSAAVPPPRHRPSPQGPGRGARPGSVASCLGVGGSGLPMSMPPQREWTRRAPRQKKEALKVTKKTRPPAQVGVVHVCFFQDRDRDRELMHAFVSKYVCLANLRVSTHVIRQLHRLPFQASARAQCSDRSSTCREPSSPLFLSGWPFGQTRRTPRAGRRRR